MLALARLLQLTGLSIPPLAIVAQLAGRISVAELLKFLLLSMGVFVLGYLMQRYSGGEQS